MKPLISILIAAYNIEKYLENCLETCVNQTYENLEIIVVNDGSTDSTLDIIKKYYNQDKRVIEVSKKNAGLVSARVAGVEKAKGDYIFFLDGDDTIPLDAISHLVSGLNNNTDIVVANYEIVSNKKPSYINSYGFKSGNNIDLINAILKNSLCNIWGNLYARYLFENVNFPLNLYKSLAEDLVTVIQIAYFAKEIKYVPFSTYHYYQRETSLIGNAKKASIWGNAFGAFVMTTEFLNKHNLLDKVSIGYLKLLKTYNLGYLVSDFSISKYENQLKESVMFVNSNWNEFSKNATKGEKLAFMLANINLYFARFVFITYLKTKDILKR